MSTGEMFSPKPKRLKLMDPLQSGIEDKTGFSAVVEKPSSDCEMGQELTGISGPLGLKLTKSSSFVQMIQSALMKTDENETGVEKDNGAGFGSNADSHTRADSPKRRISRTQRTQEVECKDKDKKKATNFSAILLRIGQWERSAKYEGELVVKCYFAKKKLVWEVLEGGLKSKIEVQWSDITALRASCPRNGPGTLEIQIAKPPLFYKESNPQPRKHTLWQASSDFTGNEATTHRRHLLKFAQGVLDKNFEKLIQADSRLYTLSKKPFISADRAFFEGPKYRNGRDNTFWLKPQGLSPSGSCNLINLSTLQLNLQSIAPEFEHFRPEEKLESSNNSVSSNSIISDGSSRSCDTVKLQELSDYLVSDGTFSVLQDPDNLGFKLNLGYIQQQHVLRNPLMEGTWIA